MITVDAIVIALPDAVADPDPALVWWRIIDGHVTASGEGIAGLPRASLEDPGAREPRIIALAPAAQTLIHQPPLPAGVTEKQALALAAHHLAENGPDSAGSLHLVPAGADGNGAPLFVSIPVAVMDRWVAWASGHGLTFDLLVPAALLLPDDTETAVRATIGGETIVRAGNLAFPAEPALVESIIGRDAAIADLSADQVERAIISACAVPPANLLTGRWARQSGTLRFDRSRLPIIARLAAALLLVSLAIPVTRIILLHRDADRRDEAAEAAAAQIITPAPAVDQAIPQLDRRLAELGGGPALLTSPLANLVQAMESAPTVNIDAIGWTGNGILSVTLGGPRNEDINPVLEAIQRDGYRITAQPRAGTDGRALADITMRSAP